MHFPAILRNYSGMTAYMCRRFIPTTAFVVIQFRQINVNFGPHIISVQSHNISLINLTLISARYFANTLLAYNKRVTKITLPVNQFQSTQRACQSKKYDQLSLASFVSRGDVSCVDTVNKRSFYSENYSVRMWRVSISVCNFRSFLHVQMRLKCRHVAAPSSPPHSNECFSPAIMSIKADAAPRTPISWSQWGALKASQRVAD